MHFIKSSLFPILVVSAITSSCGSREPQADTSRTVHNVFLVNPQPVDGASVRNFPGQVEEARTVAAGFKTGGTVERILVKEGAHVRKGQLLAVLDSTDQALSTAQLRVQTAQLQSEVARMTKLHATGGVSDNDFEKASAGLRQLEYQLAINENKLTYCRLLSPTDGVITDVKFEPGELVNAGTPIFDIMDNSHLEVVVDLPVSEYMRRADFTSFTGHTPLLPERAFPLQMLSLTPKADNNQLFQLKLALTSGDDVSLTPGMNVTVAIATSGDDSGTVTVPVNSVFDHEGQTAVFCFNPADSTIILTPVSVSGTGADGRVTVAGGLTPECSIVRAGVHHLVSGEKVRVIDSASDTNVGNLL